MLPGPNVIARRTVALAGLGIALVLPAPALAIDPGINYDPGSPAGKEYAIPLAEGRSDGAGTTDQQRGANIPFGVGITPPGSGGRGGKSGGAKSGDRGARGQQGAARSKKEGHGAGTAGESAESRNARLAEAESVGGTAGQSLLIALGVMLSAALLALLLRARQQPSQSGRSA